MKQMFAYAVCRVKKDGTPDWRRAVRECQVFAKQVHARQSARDEYNFDGKPRVVVVLEVTPEEADQ